MKKRRIILIILSVLILLGCIGMTAYLLFSNYQNVRLFKEAQSNFAQGDETSLSLAETQLLQVVRNDSELFREKEVLCVAVRNVDQIALLSLCLNIL